MMKLNGYTVQNSKDLFQTRTTDTVHDIQGSVEFAIKDEIVWGASARILEQIRLRIESGFR